MELCRNTPTGKGNYYVLTGGLIVIVLLKMWLSSTKQLKHQKCLTFIYYFLLFWIFFTSLSYWRKKQNNCISSRIEWLWVKWKQILHNRRDSNVSKKPRAFEYSLIGMNLGHGHGSWSSGGSNQEEEIWMGGNIVAKSNLIRLRTSEKSLIWKFEQDRDVRFL